MVIGLWYFYLITKVKRGYGKNLGSMDFWSVHFKRNSVDCFKASDTNFWGQIEVFTCALMTLIAFSPWVLVVGGQLKEVGV